ncbi:MULTISPECIES: hypothetical protein [unclassified Polaromonas]|jgi:hypothetical protein|uniref:hypothetical protein n=1 Tax=unclassified Polaromonas TaxID=2638319 RepID=UPI000BD12737|nr:MULTISPECIES: hypothetical protein [unclassified Polaromonas]OYY37073.1 MAG: hypothetical protein B7Y60_08865 [Polaromonas sp. 35-63-35]OYZ13594.1 MAG: hypothetical protein B7Y28_23470 [Polaromonas sp. 16-63-31]OYZ78829.1 MAG: hypothetical protein B7Y09_11130 [Polaromonas sp. 24-63-21]OZA49657.1 MAG: hypothetical protein B7X88_14700 [Polaromonas sp. 17-63-33]OZA86799.1 MAG: hypothetical protein B7X65_15120 [Polaromonas sp. 39-63-25]
MNQPTLTTEQLVALAHEQQSKLRDALAGLPANVQLDALLLAFVTIATESGLLENAGTTLINVGGSIVFNELFSKNMTRCSVPASLEVDHHAAPPIVQ